MNNIMQINFLFLAYVMSASVLQAKPPIRQKPQQPSKVTTQIIHKDEPLESEDFVLSYLDNDDRLISDAQIFWNKHIERCIELYNHDTLSIHDDDYLMLVQACILGEALLEYRILQLFDYQYQLVYALVSQITNIKGKTTSQSQDALSQIKEVLESCISYLSLFDEQFLSSALNNARTARFKHRELEGEYALMRRIAPLETIRDYAKRSYAKDSNHRISQNFKDYTHISDVRGDGNCGYRAFLGSLCMNAVIFNDFQGVEQLKNIITLQFKQLFKKYAGNGDQELKLSVLDKKLYFTDDEIESFESYLLDVLDSLKQAQTRNDIADIFNSNPQFDFYMIMFLRTIVCEELLGHQELLVHAMIAREDQLGGNNSIQLYLNHQLKFGTYIDNPEAAALAQATGIDINIINESSPNAAKVVLQARDGVIQPPILQVYLAYTDGNHYQILHPIR